MMHIGSWWSTVMNSWWPATMDAQWFVIKGELINTIYQEYLIDEQSFAPTPRYKMKREARVILLSGQSFINTTRSSTPSVFFRRTILCSSNSSCVDLATS